jgi:diguanylate cyclase (GGDEF)-like protein
MTPVKKTASPSSPGQPEALPKRSKKEGQKAPASKTKEPGFLLLAIKDIPAAARAGLLAKGVAIGKNENLLPRLSKLEKENRHLRSLSITDDLTGLYNKRFFSRQMDIEIARTLRTGEPFCLIFIDLDNFKIVNDTLGHAQGDAFLSRVCTEMTCNIRPTDFACRFGGDEFAVILPATSLRDGIAIAGRWHALILRVATDMQLPVSSSIGVDEFDASCKLSAEEFLHRVDEYLYDAKRTGKGKIAHRKVEIPESHAVTWAEKEILYHIFQPSAQKKQTLQKTRENK